MCVAAARSHPKYGRGFHLEPFVTKFLEMTIADPPKHFSKEC